MKKMWVYILECCDGSYYTGVTNNLERRVAEHETGYHTACYTFKRRPVKLVFCEVFDSPRSAIRFEKKLKGWSRAKKLALIHNDWDQLKLLSKNRKERQGDKNDIVK